MAYFEPLLAAAFLGYLLLSVWLQKSRLPYKSLFCMALAPVTGFSALSFLLFFSYLISGLQGKLISFTMYYLICALLFLRLFTHKEPQRGFQNPVAGLKSKLTDIKNSFASPNKLAALSFVASVISFCWFLYVLFYFVKLFILTSSLNAFGGWDARFFWNVKASFYFRDAASWKNMFSPILTWTHPDYPLMLPGAVAWGWNWWGKEMLVWPGIVALVFFLSITFLIVWYLASFASSWSGWLAGIFFLNVPLYPFWAVSQYADVPLCFFMSAAGVMLVCALKLEDDSLFFISGWMAGLTAWTKNEGLFFIMEITVLLFILLAMNKDSWREKIAKAVRFGKGLAIPFAAVIVLKLFLGKTGDYAGSGRTLHDYVGLLFGHKENTRILAEAFPAFLSNEANWNYLWVCFAAAIPAYLVLKRGPGRDWALALLCGFILFGYFVVLHLSPHDVRWQISTALNRLLLHPGVLALLFAFETFSPAKTAA